MRRRCRDGERRSAERHRAAAARQRRRDKVEAAKVESTAVNDESRRVAESTSGSGAQCAAVHRHRSALHIHAAEHPCPRAVGDDVAVAGHDAREVIDPGEGSAENQRIRIGICRVEGKRTRQIERAGAVVADRIGGPVDQPLAIAGVARAGVAQRSVAESDRRARAERTLGANVGKLAKANLARKRRLPGKAVRLAERDIAPRQRTKTIGSAAEYAEQVDVGGFGIERAGRRDIDIPGYLERAGPLVANLGVVPVDVPIAVRAVAVAEIDDAVAILALLVEDDRAVLDRDRRAERAGLAKIGNRGEARRANAVAALEDGAAGIVAEVVAHRNAACGKLHRPVTADPRRPRSCPLEDQIATGADRYGAGGAGTRNRQAHIGRCGGEDIVARSTEGAVGSSIKAARVDIDIACETVDAVQDQRAIAGLDQPVRTRDNRIDRADPRRRRYSGIGIAERNRAAIQHIARRAEGNVADGDRNTDRYRPGGATEDRIVEIAIDPRLDERSADPVAIGAPVEIGEIPRPATARTHGGAVGVPIAIFGMCRHRNAGEHCGKRCAAKKPPRTGARVADVSAVRAVIGHELSLNAKGPPGRRAGEVGSGYRVRWGRCNAWNATFVGLSMTGTVVRSSVIHPPFLNPIQDRRSSHEHTFSGGLPPRRSCLPCCKAS